MVSELKQIEIARILFHWITAQDRFQVDSRYLGSKALRGPLPDVSSFRFVYQPDTIRAVLKRRQSI